MFLRQEGVGEEERTDGRKLHWRSEERIQSSGLDLFHVDYLAYRKKIREWRGKNTANI